MPIKLHGCRDKNRVLFTFLQFCEDRRLWQECADESAHRIASEAHGILYQSKNPATVALH